MNDEDAPPLQPFEQKQAQTLFKELMDVKVIQMRTQMPNARVLLAAHLAARTPGVNGEVQYAAARKRWGIAQNHKQAVERWGERFKKLYDLKKTHGDVREFLAPRARANVQASSGAGAAAPCAANAHGDHLAPAVGETPRHDLANAVVAPTGSAAVHAVPAAAVGSHAHAPVCEVPGPSGAGAAAPCASTSLQPVTGSVVRLLHAIRFTTESESKLLLTDCRPRWLRTCCVRDSDSDSVTPPTGLSGEFGHTCSTGARG